MDYTEHAFMICTHAVVFLFAFMVRRISARSSVDQRGWHLLKPSFAHWALFWALFGLLSLMNWLMFFAPATPCDGCQIDLAEQRLWYALGKFLLLLFAGVVIYFAWYIWLIAKQDFKWRDGMVSFRNKAGHSQMSHMRDIAAIGYSGGIVSKLTFKSGDIVRIDEYVRGFEDFIGNLASHSPSVKGLHVDHWGHWRA